MRPSFRCVEQGELQDLLKSYFFRGAFVRDPLMLRFEVRLGKKVLAIENTEERSELIAVLSLLQKLCEQASIREKQRGSAYVGIFGDMELFLMARESDFDEMRFLLAFLAKRAWNLCLEEAEDFMKELDTVTFEAVYW